MVASRLHTKNTVRHTHDSCSLAHNHLPTEQYSSASAAYAEAANVASNPKAKVDYESLSKQIARKAPPGPDAKPYVVGNPRMDNDPFDKFVMLIGEGRKFRLDSAAVRHVLSSAEVVNAWHVGFPRHFCGRDDLVEVVIV